MSVCKECGNAVFGGVHVSYDNDDRLFVGLPTKSTDFYCHICFDKLDINPVKENEDIISEAFRAKGLCGGMSWYRPRCRNEIPCSISHDPEKG
ncbi:MAG: hypothetical protein KAS32_24195 [Candidatus Peribacteraceae bacterium]|nr:hypothetical protein [Candidatus Peribacteraceae bacterium]